MPQLILASQSPHRKGLLEQLGLPFTTQPAHVDEAPLKNEAPLAYVKRIAISKAKTVAAANPGSVVIAADTPVYMGRRILQTPQTAEEAATMIRLQSGRRIYISTVVAMADANGKIHTKTAESWIKYKRLSEEEIQGYLASNLWRSIGGAIKFEDPIAATWPIKMCGSLTGIIGLPLYETSVLLSRAGLKPKPFA